MPQLDKLAYFSQFFWLCLFLFIFYIPICNYGDEVLGISRILKLRNQLLSHRGNNIRSKDPKSLEDILIKGTCNYDPFARTKGSFCGNLHEQSSFFMVFSLFTAALSTPPDIWCQIATHFLISLIIELAIFVASIVQVREEGWTSGMRESGSINKKD